MNQKLHATDEQLELYARGRMGSELEDFEDHLMLCESCQTRLDEEFRTVTAFRDALEHTPLEEPQKAGWLDWLRRPVFALSFAAVAMVLVLGIVMSTRGPAVASLAAIELVAARGDAASIPSAKETRLTLAGVTASGALDVQVVDGSGSEILKTGTTAIKGSVTITVHRTLSPGDYFVRLSDGSKLLSEYAFRVKP